MTTTRFRIPMLVLLFAASAAGAQTTLEWITLGANDLVPSRLVPAAGAPNAPRPSTGPVTFSWALDPRTALTEPRPFVAESREHWLRATGADLAAGVPLYTLAPGALVRINPAPGATVADRPIQADALVVLNEKGNALARGAGLQRLASAEQLAAAGTPFPEGTLAFRLAPEAGSGKLTLRLENRGADEAFVIHVLDAGSPTMLRLGSDRTAYLDGETLVAEIEAGSGGTRLRLDEVTGFVTGRHFVRNARTAFACALPTARLTGMGELAAGKAGRLEVRLGVETASPGRYEVRGVLFGTGTDGALKPMAAAHTAAWLDGGGTLALAFDSEMLAASRLTPPYELRELELRDQGRMGLLEKRARGLVLRP